MRSNDDALSHFFYIAREEVVTKGAKLLSELREMELKPPCFRKAHQSSLRGSFVFVLIQKALFWRLFFRQWYEYKQFEQVIVVQYLFNTATVVQ